MHQSRTFCGLGARNMVRQQGGGGGKAGRQVDRQQGGGRRASAAPALRHCCGCCSGAEPSPCLVLHPADLPVERLEVEECRRAARKVITYLWGRLPDGWEQVEEDEDAAIVLLVLAAELMSDAPMAHEVGEVGGGRAAQASAPAARPGRP